MFIKIAGKNPIHFGALGTVGRGSGHPDGGLYNFKVGSKAQYSAGECDYYFLDRKLLEHHFQKMTNMSQEEMKNYAEKKKSRL